MKLSIERANGVLSVPPSKSALHRRLILNALAGCFDVPADPCTDVSVTAHGLQSLQSGATVDLKDCGAALRFLLPVSLLFSGARFTGSPRLSERPILPLIEVLREHGASVSNDALPLTVSGTLRPGDYALDGSVSSQFFSGLLLTLPFLSGDSTLRWTAPPVSAGYISLTERMLKEHGVSVIRTEYGYRIPGGQKPRALSLTVEGDWSCAAPMLILGAILGSVTVTGLDPNSEQPDRKVLDVLHQCGARVEIFSDSVTVSKGKLTGFKCSGEPAPDLIPALAALACASEGDSVLYRLSRLRDKESDRFSALLALLESLGADFETEGDRAIAIHGQGSIPGGKADVPPDHRMVMAAALLSAVSAKPVKIGNTNSLSKSYPGFLSDFQKIGGRIHAI